MIGTGLYETVKMACRVNSSPDQVDYTWERIGSFSMMNIPEQQIKVDGRMSILEYTPQTETDYGVFYCWGENSIGRQEVPCKFELVSAVLPTQLTNCSASKNHTNTIYISCISDAENSLPLTYVAEIYDITKDRLIRNETSSEPFFVIEDLESGSGFKIEAYSSNIRGPSEKVTFNAFTEQIVKQSMGE